MTFLKPGNRLYHYRSFETAVKHILPNFKLRLGPFAKTNDPRENKSFIFAAISDSPMDFADIDKRNQEISDILRSDCKVLSFSDDNSNYFGFERSRMWAYYGGNHKGVCFELDKTEFINENKKIIIGDNFRKINYFEFDLKKAYIYKKVNHSLIQNLGAEKYIRDVFRHANIEHLYFTKNKEWDSEAEIRLIHFSSDTNDEFCSIENSLKNIYLGVDFDEKNLQELIDLCPKVDIYKLKFKEVRMEACLLYEGSKLI